MADGRNVQTARGDVAGDKDLQLPGAETVQRFGAQRLVKIAMDRRGVETVFDQALGHHIDIALAVAEHDGVIQRRLGFADQAAQRFALGPVIGGDFHQLLGDVGASGGGARDFDARRIMQELVGQALDFRRHGGRVEQRLARKRQLLADFLDVGNETHVEHAVGFVDHQYIDLAQQQAAAIEMVHQAAGRGDQNVDAAVQLFDLFIHCGAADQQRMGQLGIFAVPVEVLRHLIGQFAGRFQHQRAGHARLGAAL